MSWRSMHSSKPGSSCGGLWMGCVACLAWGQCSHMEVAWTTQAASLGHLPGPRWDSSRWMKANIVCNAVCLGCDTGIAAGIIIVAWRTNIMMNLAEPMCQWNSKQPKKHDLWTYLVEWCPGQRPLWNVAGDEPNLVMRGVREGYDPWRVEMNDADDPSGCQHPCRPPQCPSLSKQLMCAVATSRCARSRAHTQAKPDCCEVQYHVVPGTIMSPGLLSIHHRHLRWILVAFHQGGLHMPLVVVALQNQGPGDVS